MTQTADKTAPGISKKPVEHPTIPPPRNKDPLTLAELDRRYGGMPSFSGFGAAALNSSDLAKGLSQLQPCLASPQHAAFVEAIKANR